MIHFTHFQTFLKIPKKSLKKRRKFSLGTKSQSTGRAIVVDQGLRCALNVHQWRQNFQTRYECDAQFLHWKLLWRADL